jgi:hypothetical protein
VQTGKQKIAVLPPSSEKELLEQVGDFFITRST